MTDENTPTPPPPGGTPPPPPGDAPPPPPSDPTPPGTGAPPPPSQPSSNRKLMLVLSYLGILALIPLLTESEDREVQWHARNGLGLFVAIVLISILLNIVTAFVLGDTIGCFLHCGFAIVALGVLIAAMSKALSGQKMRFPVISEFADKA